MVVEGCPLCVENVICGPMDGLFHDSNKVEVLVQGFWGGGALG